MRFHAPLYDFDHVCPESDERPLFGPPRPLPERLLDPSTWIVPAPLRFLQLQCGTTNADACDRWARELLGLYEAAWERAADDEAHADAWALREVWDRDAIDGPTLIAGRRAALEGLLAKRLTLRQISVLSHVPLDELVWLVAEQPAHRAEAYEDLAEALLAGAFDGQTFAQVSAATGFAPKCISALCKRIAVVRVGAATKNGGRTPLVTDAQMAAAIVKGILDDRSLRSLEDEWHVPRRRIVRIAREHGIEPPTRQQQSARVNRERAQRETQDRAA